MSFSALLRVNINAFEVDDLAGVANHLSLENKLVLLNQYPRSTSCNAAKTAFAESIRIDFQWIYAALFAGHRCVHRHDEREIRNRGESQISDRFGCGWMGYFEQDFTAEAAFRLTVRRIECPEALNHFLLAH